MSAVIERTAVSAPLLSLGVGEPTRIIAYQQGQPINLATFHAHVRGLAAQLPTARYAVNLCEDRYRFIVALCAAALRGQVTLLPSSRAAEVVAEVMQRHRDSYALGENELQLSPERYLRLPTTLDCLDGEVPQVREDAVAVIGFTSGSTGQPKAYPKTWGRLRLGCTQNLHALRGLWGQQAATLLATVPPQHMYGMEISVILPLFTANVAVATERPLFPQDVALALAELPAPRILVSTPVHLRALVAAELAMPAAVGLIAATAPLSVELAQQAEQRFAGTLCELFGATETAVFAYRHSTRESLWRPLPNVRVQAQADGALVHAPQLPEPVALADLMEVHSDGRFELRGRQADLLEIAGKRASLADITRRLLTVPGVEDAVAVQMPLADDVGVHRIAALVVAPTLDETTLLAALRRLMDPVFVPRRIRFVDVLPRAESGKITRAELLQLLQEKPG